MVTQGDQNSEIYCFLETGIYPKKLSLYPPRIGPKNIKFLETSYGERFESKLFRIYSEKGSKISNTQVLLLVYVYYYVTVWLPHTIHHHTEDGCNQVEVGIVGN